MTDDIVTRLQMFSLDDGTDALNKLLAEAADEIERLRALLADGLTDAYTCEGCKMCEQLKALHLEAMRNVV